MTETRGAWGYGLATLAEPGDRVLDTWFAEPRLGGDAPGEPGTRVLGQDEGPHDLAAANGRDERRGVRSVAVLTVIGSLAEPPADAHDAYLRLHLLSHRLVRPHEIDLTGLFGVLPNVAWTSHGPVDPAALPAVRMRFRGSGQPFAVTSIDKFPR
ncbi:MAG TPA: 2,3,4,5-tetrahydropyridine-2,6-dicarboxylate N-succinyltransferase, partial [Solirubrobacteraceae bacterium]|nr:2,3,4,5-tetrahydropyridine-2,6-dicarboxylate N-succinyltransferase [Solirubrobacteraceae bacterium]